MTYHAYGTCNIILVSDLWLEKKDKSTKDQCLVSRNLSCSILFVNILYDISPWIF